MPHNPGPAQKVLFVTGSKIREKNGRVAAVMQCSASVEATRYSIEIDCFYGIDNTLLCF